MAKISGLTREQRTAWCSECHSGINPIIWSTFDFKPGDNLSSYEDARALKEMKGAPNTDVHGNQVGLLTASQCYIKGQIECGTCHSVHNDAAKSVQLYSQICTNCHSEANHNFCKMAGKIGESIKTNCIDCHMPYKSSNKIIIHATTKETDFPFLARTHIIAKYPEETKKVMALLKSIPAKTASN